ncbi:MAG: hypothetical protein EHM24_26995 [Acidobacteria bacterium]|nr:MAG: hypothetical protein EHM24_26995 [Acidobacteriota bacterium]
MTDEPTCGKGLAEHSSLPRLMGDLTAATAEVLERHTHALDLDDPSSRREHEAYAGLVGEFRDVSGRLKALAGRMAGYRDLPMGRHDMSAMMDPAAVGAFEQYVRVENELLDLLERRAEQDRGMLAAMASGDA